MLLFHATTTEYLLNILKINKLTSNKINKNVKVFHHENIAIFHESLH